MDEAGMVLVSHRATEFSGSERKGPVAVSRTVTLELPDAIIAWLESSAHEKGLSAADWIILTLAEQYRVEHGGVSPQGPEVMAVPLPPAEQTDKGPADGQDAEAARSRFRRHFGRINSSDPHSADNERIDEDLAHFLAEAPQDED